MGEPVCVWTSDNDGINWYTECGHAYFPYIKGFEQPKIVDDGCPWCNKQINYEEICDEVDDM